MKKSLLALAVLGAFATAASAQSSVTLFGKIDGGIGKPVGSANKGVFDGAAGPNAGNTDIGTGGSRLGLRGVEDIGGGLKGVFAFEHRFNPDLGSENTPGQFWNAYSWVGLQTGLGQVSIGRHYTAAFLNVQNQVDPFAGETVAGLRNVGMLNAAGGVTRLRTANSVRYDLSASGFAFAFDIAEARQAVGGAPASLNPATGAVVASTLVIAEKKPWSVALSYTGGPIWLALSQEKNGVKDVKATNYGLRFTMGPATLRLGGLSANTSATTKVTGLLVGANVAMGPGDFKIGYATRKTKTGSVEVDNNKRLGLGYHYSLSKRTKIYFDVARDSADVAPFIAEDKGYDIGIQHAF
jgi:predicted porin